MKADEADKAGTVNPETSSPAVPASAQSPISVTSDPTSLLWGRQFTEWFYSGQADSIFALMDEARQQRLQSPTEMLKLRSTVQQQGGVETDVISEEVKLDTAVIVSVTS